MREALKRLARAAATVAVLPVWLSFEVSALAIGRDRALEGASQRLARVPGLHGEYLRRAFLARALRYCDPTATICYGTLLSKADTVIEARAYVGPYCHLGLVHLEADVLLAAAVHVPSGPQTHGSARNDIPIRDQPGHLSRVRIGKGTWIGSAAVVMADVGRDSIVGAGSVVTRPVPDLVIAGGVPATVIKQRASATTLDRRPA